ncbi:hypothetical protein CSW53_26495 (plasmid) [Rhodococcus ruber]|nr:hypothetical protein CSW53_26495 [Rhodococcus ruber]
MINAIKGLMGDPPPQWRRIPVDTATDLRDKIGNFLFGRPRPPAVVTASVMSPGSPARSSTRCGRSRPATGGATARSGMRS